MRDDSTPPLGPIAGPRPGFRLTDEDSHLDLGPLSLNTVQPPEPLSPWRIVAVGAVGACLLGGVVGYLGLSHHPQNAGKAVAAEQVQEAAFRPISAHYAPPDREQIRAAYRDVAEVIAKEGLSGAARASMSCYERLTHRPEYGLMDYCLALDAFGAQAYERAAGESAPSSTYFGQAPVRRQQAVQHLTAGQTDANSRLIDTNRLIGEVVLAANSLEPVALEPQVAGVTTAPVATPPAPLPAPRVPVPPPAKAAPEPSVKALPTPIIVAKAEPQKPAPVVVQPAKTAPLKAAAPKVEVLKAATPKVAPQPVKAAKPVALAKATAKAPIKPVKAPPPVLKAKTETKAVKGKEPLKMAKAKAPPAPAKPPTRLAAMLAHLKAQPVRNAAPVSPLQKASDKKPAPSPWMNQLEAELKGPAPAKPASATAVKRQEAPSKPEPKLEPKADPPPPPAPVQTAKSASADMAERKEPPAPARAAPPEPQRRVQATNDAQPSFSCRGALTRGQRMVCEEPSLAAADRRLSAVFNRALDESPNPRALIAEQNRWLAARDRMAGDYGAVMGLYQQRIAELRQGPY